MARFLLACYPIAGHRTPNIALGHALTARGHEVAIYSGSMARPAIEQAGFVYFPYAEDVDERITATLLARDEAYQRLEQALRDLSLLDQIQQATWRAAEAEW